MFKVELLMDLVMYGEIWEECWGSFYIVYVDFMNGWMEDGVQFMMDLCMNQGLDCGIMVFYVYSKVEENIWVSSEDDKFYVSVDILYVQDDWINGGCMQYLEMFMLVKFKILFLFVNMDVLLFKYCICFFGGKMEVNGVD